jgi:hypothetical protein
MENLNEIVGPDRTWEVIKNNVETSDEEILGCHDRK